MVSIWQQYPRDESFVLLCQAQPCISRAFSRKSTGESLSSKLAGPDRLRRHVPDWFTDGIYVVYQKGKCEWAL